MPKLPNEERMWISAITGFISAFVLWVVWYIANRPNICDKGRKLYNCPNSNVSICTKPGMQYSNACNALNPQSTNRSIGHSLLRSDPESEKWMCVGGKCIQDPFGRIGQYDSQEDCEQSCEPVTPTWGCVGGKCIQDPTGRIGQYGSQEDCEQECGVEPPECNNDSDCPDGYQCNDSKCVENENPSSYWWLIIMVLGLLAVGYAGFYAYKKWGPQETGSVQVTSEQY